MQQYFYFDEGDKHYSWRFKPVWTNHGQTSTRKLRIYTDCELRNTPLPVEFDFTKTKYKYGTGLAPPRGTNFGGIGPNPPAAAITAQDIADVQAGKKFLYLWGWASYYDVFPETTEHITRFCWIVQPIGDAFAYRPPKQGEPESLSFATLHHAYGNSADEDAAPQPL